jgi:iron complex outermembrane receptor protein
VRSDEHLNTFTVDTQLQSDFATGAVSHTLLTGVDYSRMRNDVNADYGTADPISMRTRSTAIRTSALTSLRGAQPHGADRPVRAGSDGVG